MYFFYGTGHNPTFTGVQWDAAFVGTGGQFSNHIVPALLVGLNTFTSHAVLSLMLPILLVAPFTPCSPRSSHLVSRMVLRART